MLDEMNRIRKVSDMLCTGHAVLRDRFSRRALILDLLILALSTWITALAFVDPLLNVKLTPFHILPTLWMGVLSIGVFFLSLVQFKTDWKGRADAHKRTLDLYAEVKREAGYLIASGKCDDAECRRVLSRYDLASAVGIEIPENDFLPLKQKHKRKLELSKKSDDSPWAFLWLLSLRRSWTENWKGKP